MVIVGGAIIPGLQGVAVDAIGIELAFFVPLMCYLYIVYYNLRGHIPTYKKDWYESERSSARC